MGPGALMRRLVVRARLLLNVDAKGLGLMGRLAERALLPARRVDCLAKVHSRAGARLPADGVPFLLLVR